MKPDKTVPGNHWINPEGNQNKTFEELLVALELLEIS